MQRSLPDICTHDVYSSQDMGEICDCPPEWTGYHCEIKSTIVQEKTCSLDCTNGGTCIFGLPRDRDTNDAIENKADFQHCACPEGWAGARCEKPYTQCGSSSKCYYGAICLEDTTCDCATATNETHSFAGMQCEQSTSTDFCSTDMSLNGKHFCLNGGSCSTEGNGYVNEQAYGVVHWLWS